MELPRLPSEFSKAARANVKAAEIRADEELRGLKTHPPGTLDQFLRYVLTVFVAFAHEVCEISLRGTWTVDHADTVARNYLWRLISDAKVEYSTPNFRVQQVTEGTKIHPQITELIAAQPEWGAYQAELKLVAYAHSGKPLPVEPLDKIDTPPESFHPPLPKMGDVERRIKLLDEYKSATSDPSHKRIYTALNSSINKPEFYEWLRGDLPDTSRTTKNFEKFLVSKKPPIPKNPRH